MRMPPFTCKIGRQPARWMFNRGALSTHSMEFTLQQLNRAFPGSAVPAFEQVLLLPEPEDRQAHDVPQVQAQFRQMPVRCYAIATVLAHTLVLQREGSTLHVYNPSLTIEQECLQELQDALAGYVRIQRVDIDESQQVQMFEPSCGLHVVAKVYDRMASGAPWGAQHSPEAATYAAAMFDCLHGQLPAPCNVQLQHQERCSRITIKPVRRAARTKGKRRSPPRSGRRLRWDGGSGSAGSRTVYERAETSAVQSGTVCSKCEGGAGGEVQSAARMAWARRRRRGARIPAFRRACARPPGSGAAAAAAARAPSRLAATGTRSRTGLPRRPPLPAAGRAAAAARRCWPGTCP